MVSSDRLCVAVTGRTEEGRPIVDNSGAGRRPAPLSIDGSVRVYIESVCVYIEIVDFGSEQGLSELETAVAVRLLRGFRSA